MNFDEIIDSYRAISVEQNESWRYGVYKRNYEHKNIIDCSLKEREEFIKNVSFKITLTPNVKISDGMVVPFHQVIRTIRNNHKRHIPKLERNIIFSNDTGKRCIQDSAFINWNGFQVIDMDIKDVELAKSLKSFLFDKLYQYNWFVGITLSSSGNGLHIYTKILVPEIARNDIDSIRKLYFTNFRHKYSIVFLTCKQYDSTITDETWIKYMDLAMCKPAQGALVPYDNLMMLSSGFFEDYIYVGFGTNISLSANVYEWVTYKPLQDLFNRWEWFDAKEEQPIVITDKGNVEVSKIIPGKYKHADRWQLANTLVNIYGYEEAVVYMEKICSTTPKNEVISICQTAKRHAKAPSQHAVNILNKYHGFKINIESEEGEEEVAESEPGEYQFVTDVGMPNPCMLNRVKNYKELYINKNQYLGHIMGELFKETYKITLIESGAGTGKTEMVKSLARQGKKVLLVMPYTSTIKSKIEDDDNWVFSYGNKRLDVFNQGNKSVALTIDKYSHIQPCMLSISGFDHIIIDESHLIFQSEYRPIMADIIRSIQLTEVPIIFMTGTPVGETIFFPDLHHIKVTKEDVRIKQYRVTLNKDTSSSFLDMCREMARDISKGRRILFPTNRGNMYGDQIKYTVQYFLDTEFGCRFSDTDPIVVNYYKKSNVGEKFMDSINKNKSIIDTDILLCSTYLSVGVDIADKYEFSVYINDLWMPQEIEQFANRIRNNDLYINQHIPMATNDGERRDVLAVKRLNLKLDDTEVRATHALLQISNAKAKRDGNGYSSNNIINDMTRLSGFIKYNISDNEYYVDEAAYKLINYERKYRSFVSQLSVIAKGMQCYGYEFIHRQEHKFVFGEKTNLNHITEINKQARAVRREGNLMDTEELLDLITEDRLYIYKDVLRGAYDVKKGTCWKDDQVKRTMTVKNVEIFEKVVPVFISLTNIFTVEDIKAIFEHCRGKSAYNFTAIYRIRTLARVMHNNKMGRLDIPIVDFMNKVDGFLDTHSPKCNKADIDAFINMFTMEYAQKESTETMIISNSPRTMKSLNESAMKLFKALVDVSRPNKAGMCSVSKAELIWTNKNDIINLTNSDDLFVTEYLFNSIKEPEHHDEMDTDLWTTSEVEDAFKISNDIVNDFNNSIAVDFC